jgi:hypothetical protein
MSRSGSSACARGTWLADRCEDEGIPVVLGHALSRRAMHGGTAMHDRIESHKIAALRRGGLMPQAYVDPHRMRATRALWRRRSCAWAMRPHQRCRCHTSIPASWRVDGWSVPLLDCSATCAHAWLTGLPLPRARHSLDGRRACQARGVDGDGPRAQPCVQVTPGKAPSAAAAHCRRPQP